MNTNPLVSSSSRQLRSSSNDNGNEDDHALMSSSRDLKRKFTATNLEERETFKRHVGRIDASRDARSFVSPSNSPSNYSSISSTTTSSDLSTNSVRPSLRNERVILPRLPQLNLPLSSTSSSGGSPLIPLGRNILHPFPNMTSRTSHESVGRAQGNLSNPFSNLRRYHSHSHSPQTDFEEEEEEEVDYDEDEDEDTNSETDSEEDDDDEEDEEDEEVEAEEREGRIIIGSAREMEQTRRRHFREIFLAPYFLPRQSSQPFLPQPFRTDRISPSLSAQYLHLSLLGREITENDYELLLQLDEIVPKKAGALPEQIQSLTTITATGEEEAIECSICLCGIEAKEKVKKLPCQHRFHSECIDKWLIINNCCPIDKISVLYSNN